MNTHTLSVAIGCLLIFLVACGPQDQGSISETKKSTDTLTVKRYGSVIKIRPEKLEEYKELHANPWPGVLEQITKSNIRNYSIYFKDDYLFSYFEYTGNDFEADMANMAKDSVTQAWWKLTDPCQEPLPTRAEGEWWASMEEVFHHD